MGKAAVVLRIGVLALQGAFREHVCQLKSIKGVVAVEVRTVKELNSVDGMIIPGGESTAIALVAQRMGLMEALMEFVQHGHPVWGTCAGLILLAEQAEGGDADDDCLECVGVGVKMGGQTLIGGLNVAVTRNFFGSQVESFETEMPMPSCLEPYGRGPFRGVFIRAPAILQTGEDIDVLCELELDEHQRAIANRDRVIVAVKSKQCLATAFHPELTEDNRWHQLFASMVGEYKEATEKEDMDTWSAVGAIKGSNLSSELPIYIHP